MNKLNFREQDFDLATKEHSCIDTLDAQMMIHVSRQEYEEARELLKDIDKSLSELVIYRRRKEEHERLLKTVEKLQQSGINLTVVKRCVK